MGRKTMTSVNALASERAPANRPEKSMRLAKDQLDELDDQGFLTLDTITDASEVSAIRAVLEKLLRNRAGVQEGSFFDMLAAEGDTSPMHLMQIKNPTDYAPDLAKTQYLRNATEMARQVLGPEARLWFDMLILKPANSEAETPWHQDEAFCDPRFEYKEITFWMPLQDTDANNGCMSFIPGTHKGHVMRHHSPGDDPTVHALECSDDFDAEAAVVCPVPAGGCSIHYGRTLHFAGANRSNQPRFAYILGFHVPPKPSREQRDFPWLAEKRTTDGAATRRWMLRGGIITIARRKWRRGELFNVAQLRYGILRSLRILRK